MTIGKIFLVFTTLLVLVALVRRFGPPTLVDYLFRARGVRPSGPHGTFTRRDILKAAGWSLGISAALAAAALGSMQIGFTWPDYTTAHQIAMVYGFGFTLLAGVAFLAALLALIDAVRWQPPSDSNRPKDRGAGR